MPAQLPVAQHGFQQPLYRCGAVTGSDKDPGGWQLPRRRLRQPGADLPGPQQHARGPEVVQHGGSHLLVAIELRAGIDQVCRVSCQGIEVGTGLQALDHLGRHDQLVAVAPVDHQHHRIVNPDQFTVGEGDQFVAPGGVTIRGPGRACCVFIVHHKIPIGEQSGAQFRRRAGDKKAPDRWESRTGDRMFRDCHVDAPAFACAPSPAASSRVYPIRA